METDERIYLCFVGGTGIGKLLLPLGEIYYSRMLKGIGIEGVIECPELTALPWGGLLDYPIRHAGVNRVREHKLGKNIKLILVGHSQGALEVELHALRHPEYVLASIGISGPFEHAPLATHLARWLPWVPDGVRQMAKGSPQLREIQRLADQHAFLRSYGDIAPLPELHRVAAALDPLVPRDSAWFLSNSYPDELVYRYLLSSWKQPVPDGVELIQTSLWFSEHLGEVFAPELIEVIKGIVRRHVTQLPAAA